MCIPNFQSRWAIFIKVIICLLWVGIENDDDDFYFWFNLNQKWNDGPATAWVFVEFLAVVAVFAQCP